MKKTAFLFFSYRYTKSAKQDLKLYLDYIFETQLIVIRLDSLTSKLDVKSN